MLKTFYRKWIMVLSHCSAYDNSHLTGIIYFQFFSIHMCYCFFLVFMILESNTRFS